MDRNEMSLRQKITIFSLTFFLLNACWASSLEQELALTENWMLASELVRLCTSNDPDRLVYCESYIEGATRFWKFRTACSSLAKSDLSYCAGAKDAREKITKALKACKDCDMTGFSDDLKTITEVCKLDKYHDEHYCSGYNSVTANSIAYFSVMYQLNIPKSARNLGMGHAESDVGLHLFASSEFHRIRPCVRITTSPQQAKKILLQFISENPEQQLNSSAIMLLAKALFYGLCPDPTSQHLKPNLENCITWSHLGDKYGAKNICNKTVVIEFVSKFTDKPSLKIEREVIPGNTFSTDSNLSRMPWRFTVCPVGYVSSVPFLPENEEDIRDSRYSCVRK